MKSPLRRLAFAVVLALSLAIPGRAWGQSTLVLQPNPAAGDDTYIAAASSVQNYGTQALIISNSQSNSPSHPLIRFNLSAIPANATILSATFEMYLSFSKVSITESLNVHRALRNWTEAGATCSIPL